MAYFLEENEMGTFVSSNLVPFILESKIIDKSEIMIFRFKFLDDDFITIVDKEFALRNSILEGEIIDLEKESKEDIFFELKPVPISKYKEFLSKNNISL